MKEDCELGTFKRRGLLCKRFTFFSELTLSYENTNIEVEISILEIL